MNMATADQSATCLSRLWIKQRYTVVIILEPQVIPVDEQHEVDEVFVGFVPEPFISMNAVFRVMLHYWHSHHHQNY